MKCLGQKLYPRECKMSQNRAHCVTKSDRTGTLLMKFWPRPDSLKVLYLCIMYPQRNILAQKLRSGVPQKYQNKAKMGRIMCK